MCLALSACQTVKSIEYKNSYRRLQSSNADHAKSRAECNFESDKIYALVSRRLNLELATRQAYVIYRSCMRAKGFETTVISADYILSDGSRRPFDPRILNEAN